MWEDKTMTNTVSLRIKSMALWTIPFPRLAKLAAIFAILYGTETVGFTARQVELVFLLGILVAVPGSFMVPALP